MKTLPASVKKLEQDSGDSSESSSEDQSKTPEDFRFVDIAILRAIFVSFLCPLCRYGHIVFEEDQNSKKGFATLLVLKGASRKCKYSKSFYTSAKIDGGQAVMAIWHHTQSTNEGPDHDFCPPGDDSWCGFQRDVVKGTSDYQHNHPLPKAVANSILPIFEALSDEDLLARCLHGGTQNQNEAINVLIWQRATKETHSGLVVVELAVFLVVSHFNDGAVSIISVLQELGIYPGQHCIMASQKLDHNRLRHSRRKSSERAKSRRKQLRNLKMGYIDSLEAREGQQYEAGAF